MEEDPKKRRVWRFLRWPLLVLVLLYVGVVIYRVPAMQEKQKTAAAVAFIQNQKLTWATASGANLPEAPDEALNNVALVGTDVNHNGIRDDVELAIVKLHPSEARVRAEELQYALELQLEFSSTFNAETLAAVLEAEGRGFVCLAQAGLAHEVEGLVFNTSARKQARENLYNKYMSTFALRPTEPCDVASSSLPN